MTCSFQLFILIIIYMKRKTFGVLELEGGIFIFVYLKVLEM